ncbi:hypothetical protein N566_16590 [Streptomycetaceae bacterium MP113-05]|nr:hypothetical protein N566_16590 [Streptomycetaceae bacterium MP113-05]
MKGRHTATRCPQPDVPGVARPTGTAGSAHQEGAWNRNGPSAGDDARHGGGLPKKLALWSGLAVCIAFIAWVAWGAVQFDHDVEHPREGGLSGWQCDAGRDCYP